MAPRIPFVALAVVAILAAAGTPAAAAPKPSFKVTPDPPVAGAPATFTSTSTPDDDEPITGVAWDFGGGPGWDYAGSPVTVPVGRNCGTRTFRMRVTDEEDSVTSTFTVDVVPGPTPPVAQFRFSPLFPVVGQEVLFESLSYDPDGTITRYDWDVDGDGFDDGGTPAVPHTFASPGTSNVALRVTDNSCRTSVAATPVTVFPAPPNQLPVAQFAVSPLRPHVGEQVALRSYSYDPDGSIVSQRWDLDGDGEFDDSGDGSTAFTVFPTAGQRIVRLEVRDSAGGVQTETQNITVDRRPKSRRSLINPFPVARLAGSVYPRGVQVKILEVRSPARSRVLVRCLGKSCPDKQITKLAKRKKKPVRFEKMTRFLRAGTVLEVLVRKADQIGKYTRWLIRGGKLPKRKDLCLYPGASKARACP